MMVGLPGSGKSTYAKEIAKDIIIDVRVKIDKIKDQEMQRQKYIDMKYAKDKELDLYAELRKGRAERIRRRAEEADEIDPQEIEEKRRRDNEELRLRDIEYQRRHMEFAKQNAPPEEFQPIPSRQKRKPKQISDDDNIPIKQPPKKPPPPPKKSKQPPLNKRITLFKNFVKDFAEGDSVNRDLPKEEFFQASS